MTLFPYFRVTNYVCTLWVFIYILLNLHLQMCCFPLHFESFVYNASGNWVVEATATMAAFGRFWLTLVAVTIIISLQPGHWYISCFWLRWFWLNWKMWSLVWKSASIIFDVSTPSAIHKCIAIFIAHVHFYTLI